MEAVEKFNLLKKIEIRLNRSEVTKYLASIDRRVPSAPHDVTIKAEPGAENEDDMSIIKKTEGLDTPDTEEVCVEVGVRGLHCPTCDLIFKYELHLKHHLTTNKRCAVQDNQIHDITDIMSSSDNSSNALPTPKYTDVTVKEKTDYELPRTDSLNSSDPELTRSWKVKGFPCPKCQLTFKYRLHLTHHLNTNKKCAVQCRTNQDDGVKEQRKQKYSCPVCKKELSRAFILRDHMAIHSDERPFVCSTCLHTFKLQEYLDRHTLNRHKFNCKICQLCFVKASSLNEHVAQSHPDGLTQVQLYNNHKIDKKKNHETEKPVSLKKFSCPDCKKEFNYFSILRSHMRIHRNVRSLYQCDEPKMQKDLKIHESVKVKNFFPRRARNKGFEMNNVHTNARPYVCSTCRHSFERGIHLNKHTKKEHSFKCPDCELSFVHKLHVADHAIHYHETVSRKYLCRVCRKEFNGRSSLLTHMRVHSKNKPFVCSECQAAFRDKSSLNRHTLNNFLIKCDNCELVLDKLSLEKHVSLHHQEELMSCDFEDKHNNGHIVTPAQPPPLLPCKCNVCKICFQSHFLLVQHMRIHKKMKQKSRYQCDQCGMEVIGRKEWIMHSKSHDMDQKVFPCHECNKEFGTPHHLRRHMNTVHSKYRPFVCQNLYAYLQVAGSSKIPHSEGTRI